MRQALLFRENHEPVLVSAEEVKNGIYSRYDEFVDPEYEFKVQFVKGARNNGGPYFRLYYSYEEYKKIYPERASRYEIVANMRKFEESAWHKKWKENVSDFCTIEKCIKNPSTNKWKFADAFYDKAKTCIEFQHSYIALDFEERNEFYKDLSIKTIWLYDLPRANACQDDEGNIEILEDNARGFFRISENPDNLKNHFVYIQVQSGMIYRVVELFRRETSTEQKSTIRFFVPTETYTEEEFVDAIQYNKLETQVDDVENNDNPPRPLIELWSKKYAWMTVRNVENGDLICVNRNHANEIFRDYSSGCIKYVYVDDKYGNRTSSRKKEYLLSHQNEKRAVWVFVKARYK